jgi:hypothetical protein
MTTLIKAKRYRRGTLIEDRTKVEVWTCQILTLKKYSLKSMFHWWALKLICTYLAPKSNKASKAKT